MSRVLYLVSLQPRAGKTALAATLGTLFRSQGQTVGYIKPIRAFPSSDAPSPDRDAAFMRQFLGLDEPVERLAPLQVSPTQLQDGILSPGLLSQAKVAVDVLAQDRSVVLVEGTNGGLAASQQLAESLDAEVVLVVQYRRGMAQDEILGPAKGFGARLLGVLLNQVPALSQGLVTSELLPSLKAQGVPAIGALPEDRLLLGPTVQEIASALQATVLLESSQMGEVVEHVQVGALTLDSAVAYFERRPNKAVIAKGDKPDVQWCALQTSTRCLVLTWGLPTIAYVMERAKEFDVPVLLTDKDTLTTLAILEQMTARMDHPKKVERFQELLQGHGDLGPLVGAVQARA
jgi:BioD-like phosphotransacetylase family protein